MIGNWVFLIPLLPAAGAAVLLMAGRRLKEPFAGWIATGTIAASFVLSVLVFFRLVALPGDERHLVITATEWIDVGAFRAAFDILVDPLSVTMILVVTGVGMLIHLYSIAYMHGDEGFTRFFGYLNLFAASMLTLVLANNLVLMFLGWEGVGLCSYLLISFWFTRESAAVAGKKAFVTNRVGDFGFILAILLVFTQVGTVTFVGGPGGGLLTAGPAMLTSGVATAICLLFFLGAAGKSAQLPLLVWLPDAMEGPTPVSALIHAATMVTAGVYLIVRLSPIYHLSATAGWVVAAVGVATALVAATVALVQTDLKRVLAYSTVSQLGFMFAAVGVGAYVAGMFLLVTHAFFKAVLFLGAGSVMHAMDDRTDMRGYGGLRSAMPITHATFLVGWLAIAGIPPLSGFFAKDEILAAVFGAGRGGLVAWVVLSLTALLTATYMSRAFYLTFWGEARHDESVAPHESPVLMTVPMVVLAAASVVGGLLGVPKILPVLEHWLEPSVVPHPVEFGAIQIVLMLVATALALVGIFSARAIWLNRSAAERGDLLVKIPAGTAAYRAFTSGWGLDALYETVFVKGGGALSRWLAGVFDKKVIDGVVNGTGAMARDFGREESGLQTGFVRNYALAIAIGTVVLGGAVVLVKVVAW